MKEAVSKQNAQSDAKVIHNFTVTTQLKVRAALKFEIKVQCNMRQIEIVYIIMRYLFLPQGKWSDFPEEFKLVGWCD